MKRFTAILAVTFCLSAAHAFSGERYAFDLPLDSELAGTALKSGKYQLEVSGDGQEVAVRLLRGKKLVLESKATRQEPAEGAKDSFVKLAPTANGGYYLTEIRPSGEPFTLRFDQALAESRRDETRTASAANPRSR